MLSKAFVTETSYRIIGCAIEVHKQLGPGLLESVYQECMIEELMHNGISLKSQSRVPLFYRGKKLRSQLTLDLIVEDCIIVELKAIEGILPVHKAQQLSYMKLTGAPKGLLINFNVENIVQRAVHLVSETFATLP